MRNEYYDDYEQAEAVKKWLKENGLAIFTGIALGLGALFGWRYWEGYAAGKRAEAARAYEQLVADLGAGREASAEVLESFRKEHQNAAFIGLAALELSAKAISERNLDEAMRLLEIASQSAEPPAMRQVAGLRLARVQLQAGQIDRSLATIDRFDDGGFAALAAEIRGDALLAKGDREGAREAYRYALDNLSGGDRSVLQMKLDDLTPPLAVAAASTPASAPEESPTAEESEAGSADESASEAALPAVTEAVAGQRPEAPDGDGGS